MSEPTVAGKRVLVVEDEALVVMMLEEMLVDMGCAVAGIAAHLGQATETIDSQPCDCVLLDINLGGQPAYGLARKLARRGTPFVFVTGYDRPDLPEDLRGRPVLRKPFDLDGLRQAIAGAIGPQRPAASPPP